MADDLEVELKLEAGNADLDALVRSPLLSGTSFVRKEQVSTYYDTPDRDLHSAGLSLRVRRSGGRHVQTVKAEAAAAAGLFVRPEWETELAGSDPQPNDPGNPLRTLVPEAALHGIAPVFRAEVARMTGRVRHEGGDIEIVLDTGRVLAGDRSDPVNEVELELKDGPASALFSLARAMNAAVPLRLGVLAKSERGYRLADGCDQRSIKVETGAVTAGMTVAQAFGAIVATCLRHFRLNEATLERTGGPEALHQARVALRRLRSALSIFKPVVADGRFEGLRADLRWLAATLGDARDIDVLLARDQRIGVDQLRAVRERAYAEVRTALGSDRVRGLMIGLAEWATVGEWRTRPDGRQVRDGSADRFAADTLERLRRRVKRRGRDLVSLSDEKRHEVRILAKKLRYASEFFVALFSGDKSKRRGKAFLSALAGLQQQLGDLNDFAHGPHVLARLGIEVDHGPASAKQRQQLLEKAADAHAEFADTRRFWR